VSATTAAGSASNEWVRHVTGPVRRILNVLLSVALTFLGLTCVTFFIGCIVPIDPVLAIVGEKARPITVLPP
jgi:peptide/nickel transport system permease protein